jgi:hypothetical protein
MISVAVVTIIITNPRTGRGVMMIHYFTIHNLSRQCSGGETPSTPLQQQVHLKAELTARFTPLTPQGLGSGLWALGSGLWALGLEVLEGQGARIAEVCLTYIRAENGILSSCDFQKKVAPLGLM